MDKNNIHINEEIAALSPLLSKISKEIIADVPKGYFEDTEEQMNSQIAIILADDKKMPNFPDGYFESLEEKILNRIQTERISQPRKLIAIISSQWMKVAASLILILSAIFVFNREELPDVQTISITNDWDEQEAWDYLIENSDDISLILLIDEGLVEASDLIVSAE